MITLKAKRQFFNSLESYINSGVPIQQVFQTRSSLKTKLFRTLAPHIEAGDTLSSAMEKSGLFVPMEIGLVAVGEETANLPDICRHLAAHLDCIIATKRRALLGLILPVFYIHTAAFLLPIAKVFTGAITAFEYFLQAGIIIALTWGVVFFVFITLPYLIAVNFLPEVFINCVPILGGYYKRSHYGQFLDTMSMGLAAGMPLIRTLRSAAGSCSSKRLSEKILNVADDITKTGCRFSSQCEFIGLNNNALTLIETGEQTGQLAEKLHLAAQDYYSTNKRIIMVISIIAPLLIYGCVAVVIAYQIILSYMSHFDQVDEVLNSMNR